MSSLSRRLFIRLRRAAAPLALAVLVLVACVVPMALSANWSELNTAPDEAAHYVTALMIRSYVTEGLGSNPREFAEQYYVKYPKVAFGIWPPLFHLLLGGWLLLTGPSFVAALAFVALTTVLVAVVLFQAGRELLGIPLALAGAVWFATFPIVQAPATSVMVDMLCALLILQAAFSFGRYMDAPSRGRALVFACAAGAALLTKYNAFALALVPPIAVVAGRQWSLLRRMDFWIMPAAVLIVAAPWYLTHLDMVRYASQPLPPSGAWRPASLQNFLILSMQVGVLGIPLAALGINDCVLQNKGRNGVWCSMLAVLVAVWAFHSLLYPIIEPRYLLAPAGVLALFGAAGIQVVVTHMLPSTSVEVWHRVRAGAAVLLLVVLATWAPRPRPARGFAEAASVVLDADLPADTTTLVSSDPIGEGAFVSYVATHAGEADGALVIRASKILAVGTWMGLNYASRYSDVQSISRVLDRARVQFVVVDDLATEPHHLLLERTVRTSPQWRLARSVKVEHSSAVRIYERTQPLPPGKPEFELDTHYSLGRNIRR
ncbi:putative membrane protein [Luteitalea pratensis]|uniref:Putative membrane protein n=1 Tax=Luteitalea pratensis TaxID=1855912 RepID=A0A143PUN5_LUTPR|nr:glycosyltransferase family 39 protein [Luteitalea pratensis]AMY11883.1 putative membrane protein [Luteitalea pratensis]